MSHRRRSRSERLTERSAVSRELLVPRSARGRPNVLTIDLDPSVRILVLRHEGKPDHELGFDPLPPQQLEEHEG